STRREPPSAGPSMAATSLEIASTTTVPTEDAENGTTKAKGRNNTTSDTTSPTSFRTPPRRLFCPKSIASVPSMVAQPHRNKHQTGQRPKKDVRVGKREYLPPKNQRPKIRYGRPLVGAHAGA